MLDTNRSQLLPQYQEQIAGTDPWHYVHVLKKRWLLFCLPAVVICGVGIPYVILRPATYLSQGKILVESQQIPVELVRPTVTATAAARVQVLEQRLMTRDNLLSVANKFHVFDNERAWIGGTIRLSGTELLDRMRARTSIAPVEFESAKRQQSSSNAFAFSVSFEHERPDIAAKVANELVTVMLAEDARNRTNRAAETTQFLAREQKRLETALAGVETRVDEIKRKNSEATVAPQLLVQLSTLKAELEQKSTIYSPSHPALKPLQQQVAALEKLTARSNETALGYDALLRQRAALQFSLEDVSQKLTLARRGENLERDQQAERLEVLEQPVTPTDPVKGKRLKFIVAVIGAAFAVGIGGVLAAESWDRTIRGASDLSSTIDPRLLVSIPYIATEREISRAKTKMISAALSVAIAVLGGVTAVHFLWLPLDQLWDKVLLRLAG